MHSFHPAMHRIMLSVILHGVYPWKGPQYHTYFTLSDETKALPINTSLKILKHATSSDATNLNHWGRVTHICISNLTIIVSDNALSPDRRQVIIWSNWTLRNKIQWNLNRNSYVFTQENTSETVAWKTAAILSRPQCIKNVGNPLQFVAHFSDPSGSNYRKITTFHSDQCPENIYDMKMKSDDVCKLSWELTFTTL